MKILIIEDERPINNLIRSTLTADGYSCDCAFDGKEGADLIEQRQYDLILLDLMLPEISGYDLLEYIRSLGNIRAAQIPVIIISAMGQVQDRIRGLHLGADDYLCKPFQIGELAQERTLQGKNPDRRCAHFTRITAGMESRDSGGINSKGI